MAVNKSQHFPDSDAVRDSSFGRNRREGMPPLFPEKHQDAADAVSVKVPDYAGGGHASGRAGEKHCAGGR